MSQADEPEWITKRMRELEKSGVLIKRPIGWEPPPIQVEDIAVIDADKVCGFCGFGEELEALEVWRDADGEGWWVHPLCRDIARRRPTYAEAASEAHRPGNIESDA